MNLNNLKRRINALSPKANPYAFVVINLPKGSKTSGHFGEPVKDGETVGDCKARLRKANPMGGIFVIHNKAEQ